MHIIIVFLILLGAIFILVAAIGLVRFNDLYSRMHSTTKATSFGLLLLVVGVSMFFSLTTVWVKAIMVIVFIYLTAPLAAHSLAKSDEEKEG